MALTSREAIGAIFSSTNHLIAMRRQAQALLMTLKADIAAGGSRAKDEARLKSCNNLQFTLAFPSSTPRCSAPGTRPASTTPAWATPGDLSSSTTRAGGTISPPKNKTDVFDISRWTLIGITSAGFGCAVDKQPGIYHKIGKTAGWINSQISSRIP